MLTKLKATQHERRFNHTLGVVSEAERLAPMFGVDVRKAKLTALLHDCAKNLDESTGENFFVLCQKYGVKLDECAKNESALVHAFLGAAVAYKEYGIEVGDIVEPVFSEKNKRVKVDDEWVKSDEKYIELTAWSWKE